MEACSSGVKRPLWPKDQFTDLVLPISLEKILDENLYKYQVEKIPMSFQSVDQYFDTYIFPLLEETRAALASAVETVYKAPFAEVTSLCQQKSDRLYNVEVDYWRNKVSERGKEPYKTLPGDAVMFTNLKPESASDLQRFNWTYSFALVQNISEDMEGKTTQFRVQSAKDIDVEEGLHNSLYVVFLMNITTNKRIWKALHMRGKLSIVRNILSKNELDEEKCESCLLKCNDHHMDLKVASSLLYKLNESQNQAITDSLLRVNCDHRSSVQLIWGPPGTGKTSTLSVLLYILLKMNVRTLVCAPTNVSITELASRVLKLVRDSARAEFDKGFLSYALGNILLFGNKDRLKVSSDIKDIFLDYRVDQLECLVWVTGWKHRVESMIDFLENCVSQHCIYMDNELKANENPQDEIKKPAPKSFLKFARERCNHIIEPLRMCMLTFFTHLPRALVLKQNVKYIEQVMCLLNLFEIQLSDKNMTSKELKNIFLEKGNVRGFEYVEPTSLLYIRSQCLSILRVLCSSLANLDLPHGITHNRTSAMEFCFQKASLIFCTVSSSFKLHSMNMEPVQLLVIDEAAQVKECESLIALQIQDVRHAILFGDEWQLPATVNSKVSEEAGFGRSLFERLSSTGHFKHLLDMQYRMHPSISRFPNSRFYCNQILDAPIVKNLSYERCYLQGLMFGPYSFIDVADGVEELDDVGKSRRNTVEVAIVVKLVQKLSKAWNGWKDKVSIGVISPYAAQVVAIQNKLKGKYENHERILVKVKSVDGFQGGEEDIIIISTVRANKGGSIGFLSSPQRTNVALTRARHCLWIVGNARTLSKSDSVWEALIADAKHRRCFFTADEDRDVAKTVVDIKKELDQLEDMLNGDNILFKSARWKVLFSDNFRKSFGILKPSCMKKLALNLILKLASGWRPKKINVNLMCEGSSHLVKQFKVEEYYVICSIDVIKESVFKQVLKVWDILSLEEIPKLLKRLENIFYMYTDDFTILCNEKIVEGNLEVPKSWPTSRDIVRFKNLINTKSGADASENRSYVENSRVSESLLLMKFYSLSTSTVNHLLFDHEGKEVDLPFEVTDEERDTIIFPRSSFILGRSGTGKTTVLTMKLYRNLQQYSTASGERIAADNEYNGSNLRQLFVTVSPKLCYAVKRHVSQLKRFAIGNFSADNSISDMDDIDEIAEFKDIPDTFVGIEPEKYPLIITFRKFIMMLDGVLGKSYFERFHELRDTSESEFRSLRSVALQTFVRNNEVTFDRFLSFYWPHFNSKMIKNFDSSRVFTEIMSYIKGGLSAGGTCVEKLSRQEYIFLSECRMSTLSAEKRDTIYNIYQDYEKMKMLRGEFDLADLVIDIHLRLSNENLCGDKMDFVYIDEVQDLTMNQIALFRYICKNVDEGFVFSGDTAQTIARGIDFRFEDVRSLFYNEFMMKSENPKFGGMRKKGLISDIFCLSHNFRTHIGVLRLAQSIIDLICYFFPQSIDVLAPETSLIYGEPPVLLEPGGDENSILTIFGHNRNAGGGWVGFGAQQVILVRDDSARNEISNYVGRQAIILTIVECKGLEFQDVLLYNFFGSSPLSDQWRVIYEFLEEKDLLDNNCPKSFPNFGESRHNILCSELKQLYVAITRTRQRLWICEKNEDLAKPMFDYWRRLCLVQVRKVDASIAEAMQRASTPEEWKSQGIKLFWERNYEMAMMCFEKAGEEMWEKRAKASSLRSAADNKRVSNPLESRIMLTEAAEMFDSIGRAESAAECFCDLGQYERAGKIYSGMPELRKAGECFTLAGCHDIAAETYFKGNFFSDCLLACTKGKYFDTGLQYIENWKQQALWDTGLMTRLKDIDKSGQDFLESCARECYAAKDNESLLKFVRAFQTMEFKRNFLRSLDCLKELLVLEEESGNFGEAAEIAKVIGDVELEVDMLGKAGEYANASFLILCYVLSNSLWISGSQGWPLKSFPKREQLLNKAISFADKVSESFHESICKEAGIFLHGQKNLSELMRSSVISKLSEQCETQTAEILSVRQFLDAHFQVNPANYDWENVLPEDWKVYSDEINLRNQVSLSSLRFAWYLHLENSIKIFNCLDFIEREGYTNGKGTFDFCLKYFGVRYQDGISVTCRLLNPNAEWVKNVNERFIIRHRNMVSLDVRHFALAARKYLSQELVSFTLRVLEALQALHRSSIVKRLSDFCQSRCLTCMFDIANGFIDLNSHDLKFGLKKADLRRVHDFIQFSTKYLEFVFPSDRRQALSENMISLRETIISKKLLEYVMSGNIDLRSELTYGQIGRVVMTWLGSRRPNPDLYEKIAQKFSVYSSWKSFIEILYKISEMECVSASHLSVLSYRFQVALADTFNANWRTRDYISPHCFLYLVERLLILVPHSQGFVFTTKSCFVEWLICQQSDTNPNERTLYSDEKFAASNIFNFVASVVTQLLRDSHGTAQWVMVSGIDYKYYFPVLILRLIMILCLLCLNGIPFSTIFEMLNLPQIRSQLPKQFCEAIGRKKRNPNIADIAEAFKAIGDPLVILALTEDNLPMYPNAISLDRKCFSCKDDIMKTLFPPTTEAYSQQSFGESRIELSPLGDSQAKNTTMLSNWWVFFKGLINMLESVGNENREKLESLNLEVELEHLKMLSTALASFTSHMGLNENTLSEAKNSIEELNQLSSLLSSGVNQKKLPKILELAKKLESRGREVDALLGPMNLQNDTNAGEIDDDGEVSKKNLELDTQEKMAAEPSQGKKKANNNNNNKKKKKKKGGKKK